MYWIGFGIFIIGLISLCVWSFNYEDNKREKTRKLFDEKLKQMCHNATTYEEVNDAWNVLISECISNEKFIIASAWFKDFYELRGLLQGKFQVLRGRS